MSEPLEQGAIDGSPTDGAQFRESVGLVGAVVFVLALMLAALTPFAAHPQPVGKAWFQSPRNMPLIGIGLMLIAGGSLGVGFFRRLAASPDRRAYWRQAFAGFAGFRLAVDYSILFGVYVYGVSYAGFAIATVLFGQACLLRAGLTGWRWAGWNLVFAAVLVVVLRVLMGLWFPQAPILEFTPAWFANSIGPYL